jgi:hypothetical protein
MKNKHVGKLSILVLVLVFASLACGGGSEVQVNAPVSQEDAVNTQVAVILAQGGDGDSSTAATVTEQPALGTARSNPAPAGSEIIADGMAFTLTGSVRPATQTVMSANQFNSAPEADEEYVLVSVSIACQKTVDEKCSIFSSSFKMLGSSGITSEPEIFVAGVPGLLDFNTEFYGGASISGAIPFIVSTADTGLLLVYEPFLGDSFYLAIE